MNDRGPIDTDDLPEWAGEIVERHDLSPRTDIPLAGETVLLTDAAHDLTEPARTAFREQALTGEVRTRAAACVAMVADALKLAALCPGEASAGTVTEAADGTLVGSPGPLVDEPA